MKSFNNKVAVITGGASGIGKALAFQLSSAGAKLAIADLDEEALAQTVDEICQRGGEVSSYIVDVADREAVYDFAADVISHYGAVHIVINNAGMVMGSVGIEDLKYDDFARIMDVNLWGVVHGTQAFLPHLLEQAEANLLNISSVYGLTAKAQQTAYSTSKFAVRGFTEAIRQELRGTSVTVAVVFPGGVQTDLLRNSHLVGDGADTIDLERVSKQLEKYVKTTAAEAASAIIEGIKNKATRVLIGEDAHYFDMIARKNPGNYGLILERRRTR